MWPCLLWPWMGGPAWAPTWGQPHHRLARGPWWGFGVRAVPTPVCWGWAGPCGRGGRSRKMPRKSRKRGSPPERWSGSGVPWVLGNVPFLSYGAPSMAVTGGPWNPSDPSYCEFLTSTFLDLIEWVTVVTRRGEWGQSQITEPDVVCPPHPWGPQLGHWGCPHLGPWLLWFRFTGTPQGRSLKKGKMWSRSPGRGKGRAGGTRGGRVASSHDVTTELGGGVCFQ